MRSFTRTYACASRLHCRACRTDAAFRKAVGGPETCPFGLTEAVIPPKSPPPRPARSCPKADRVSCGNWTCAMTGRQCPHPHLPVTDCLQILEARGQRDAADENGPGG